MMVFKFEINMKRTNNNSIAIDSSVKNFTDKYLTFLNNDVWICNKVVIFVVFDLFQNNNCAINELK